MTFWIAANANGDRFRTWNPLGPAWTSDKMKALRFVRREDAEAVFGEDEETWKVLEIMDQPDTVAVPRTTLEWIKKKTADKRNPAVAFVCDKLLKGEDFSPLRDVIPETHN